jgi:hypothetical protein
MHFFEHSRMLLFKFVEGDATDAVVGRVHVPKRLGRTAAVIEERVVEIEKDGANRP